MQETSRSFERRASDLVDKLLTDPPRGEVALEILRYPGWPPQARRSALKARTQELIKQNPHRGEELKAP